jgi:ferredoxin
MDIKKVGDRECINCGSCIPVCPTKAISWKGGKIKLHANEIEPTVNVQVEEEVNND